MVKWVLAHLMAWRVAIYSSWRRDNLEHNTQLLDHWSIMEKRLLTYSTSWPIWLPSHQDLSCHKIGLSESLDKVEGHMKWINFFRPALYSLQVPNVGCKRILIWEQKPSWGLPYIAEYFCQFLTQELSLRSHVDIFKCLFSFQSVSFHFLFMPLISS